MAERRPYHPPIPEPQRAPHEGGNSAAGLPRTLHESAKPPPEAAVNKPPPAAEERREKHRKYMKDYRKRNTDKVNDYQRRYRSHGPSIGSNEKLREHQARLAEVIMERKLFDPTQW
jgi:hypothetical protein